MFQSEIIEDVLKKQTELKSEIRGMVSVIIPNYNHASYIADAIQSVLNQDYQNYEIIVVDDGSTDNSRQVVSGFGERVRYIYQENQGLSAARNTGIATARGEYIALLDADDMYEPGFLSTLVPMLQADPEAAGIYCGYRFVDHLNHPLPQIEARKIPQGQLYRVLLDGNFLVPESMLVRSQCYQNTGLFDENLTACEDWDMWLRMSARNKFIGTEKVLTRHRILPGSMSTNPNRMLDNRLVVLSKHFGMDSSEKELKLQIKKRAYGQVYLTSSVEFQQSGDIGKAYECFRKMVEWCPDLLTQVDTFYRLGCGQQPKGYMGHFASMDLKQNAEILLDMLDRLFDEPDMPVTLRGFQREAYAKAFFSLALLNYGARRFQETRWYLLSAVRNEPCYGFKRQFLATLLKSLMDPRLIDRLRSAKK